jgi:epothilone synthetase B
VTVQNPTDFNFDLFLDDIRAKGIMLGEVDGQLRIWGPDKALKEPNLLANIREHKTEILRSLDESEPFQSESKVIKTDPKAEHRSFPLTEIQRAYWLGRQQVFNYGDVAIHYYTEVDCEAVDWARLQAAWNRTVRHHGMLRAVVDDTAMQRILPEVPEYEIPFTDLSARSELERQEALDAHREANSHKVHRTDRWPGFDLHLFRRSGAEYRLTYSQDLLHIDGGSLLILIDDFCRWYADPQLEKETPGLSFRDYVNYEIALKETENYQTDLAYWREAVKSLPRPPALPLRARAKGASHFTRLGFQLDTAAYKEIRRQAVAMNITPTGYVLAAFADIVSLWNGSEDYSLNVTLFNRPNIHPDIHRIAGDFTSMVPVAVRRGDGETLGERARAMQKSLWDHIGHKDVSGIMVLDLLRESAGDHSAAELSVVFTSLLNLGNQGFSRNHFSTLGKTVYTVTQTPQVTLDHQVAETPDGGIGFSWDVAEGLFPEGMIDDMFAAYEALMRRLSAEESAWTDPALDHLPQWQKNLFSAVNDTAVSWSGEQTLRDLIYNQAVAQPDLPALVSPDCALDYAELLAVSERLAAKLLKEGVRPGERVGVFMEKGWPQPIAAIAAHMAGAAYVPIDPTVPKNRLAYIIDDASLNVLLVDGVTGERFTDLAPKRILVDAIVLTAGPRTTPEPLSANAVSHVIYTSGSTGQPKGVVIEHRNVVNRILDINMRFKIKPGDALLGLTALHHDLSVFDIFGLFAAGAKLILPREDERLDPAHWCTLMEEYGVTLWNSVPAFAGMLADYLEAAPEAIKWDGLRWMILAGDWIPVALPGRLKSIWPGLDFIASGGPTETTIWDIWNPVGAVEPNWPSIPYGKPLANAAYHVIDREGRRCPVWVSGELYIGGAGVTREYLNRPELTAEKYVTHPGIEGRLFKSGDMGRYLPDGSIEFLGRNDFQVKINGQRIELGEIEKATLELAGVKDCAAVVQTTPQGPMLALFATSSEGGTLSEEEIAAQEAAFVDHGINLSDPAKRLSGKLSYVALSPPPGAKLLPIGSTMTVLPLLKSHREFAPGPISMAQFREFFAPLRGHRDPVSGEAKFQYGSAGGLYPVQVYVYVKPEAVEALAPGIYRYFPLENALEMLSDRVLPDDIHWGYNRAMGVAAAFYVYLIADPTIVAEQYGDGLAEPMVYIEAGMISQRLRHAAVETGFGVCSVGDIQFERYAEDFRLSKKQKLLTAMVAGLVAPQAQRVPEGSLADRIREELSARLPPHMIPTLIAKLPALPLTGNGKVDRKTLMAMDVSATAGPREFVAPENAFETTVAGVLSDLLRRERISMAENFFDLGASSALLVKAYHAITEKTGATFPLISLFRFPTVRSLAESIKVIDEPADIGASATRAEKQKQALRKLRNPQKEEV